MKNRLIMFLSLSIFSISAQAYDYQSISGLQDFYAPIVNSKTNLPGTVPAGTIIYENNSSSFHGLRPDGTWANMGGAGSVLSPNNSAVRIASARVDTPSANACSVSSVDQDGAWITGCSGSSSVYTLNLNTSSVPFSSAPRCTCTPEVNNVAQTVCNIIGQPTTTSIVIKQIDNNGLTFNPFHIICIGPQ